MLKLMIVDDEKIIRETIQSFIDWNSLGIHVTGVCKDGIEALHMIMDEFPDIILTDIKMPGLSGLELIERSLNIDHNIEFVILSGYSDFDYAKQAMKYGVKHYLLKPCNELQIIDAIKLVKEDCCKKRATQAEKLRMSRNLEKNMFKNLIFGCMMRQSCIDDIIREYEPFLDFENTSYELNYFYFVEETYLNEILCALYSCLGPVLADLSVHIIYVKNTLLLFFQNRDIVMNAIEKYIQSESSCKTFALLQYQRESFSNLTDLLEHLVIKLKRYEKILLIEDGNWSTIYNYNALFQKINVLVERYADKKGNAEDFLAEIEHLLRSTDDSVLLKAFSANLMLKLSTALHSSLKMSDFLLELHDKEDMDSLRALVITSIQGILKGPAPSNKRYKYFIEKTIQYLNNNLSNPNLSLKWIAENYMYMNADYLSKQFFLQTGYKFSYYLSTARVERAKLLLEEYGQEKIYTIAEQVGCGNNPQYFSQIFRKHTGLTPTAYIKKIMEESE